MPAPPAPPPPEAVLFDLDGTLLDSITDLAGSANSMLYELGHPGHPEDAYRHFVGDGARQLVRRCLPVEASCSEKAVDHALEVFRGIYRERWHDRTAPYPGIPEALADLAAAGIRLAVLSNKPHEFTTACVDHFFPGRRFATVLGQKQGLARKPDPAGALGIASGLGIDPADCAFVGDTDVDMLTAVNAGMRPVGVLWGFRDEAELRAGGAVTIVPTVGELAGALGL